MLVADWANFELDHRKSLEHPRIPLLLGASKKVARQELVVEFAIDLLSHLACNACARKPATGERLGIHGLKTLSSLTFELFRALSPNPFG